MKLLEKIADNSVVVGVIGLGYVGIPLAIAFSEKNVSVIGFDVNKEKSAKKNFVIFIILSIIGLIITEIIMWIGSDIMKINYLIVKIIATAIVMVFNFITRKMFLE